jgi:AraC-like DNA-binding protein
MGAAMSRATASLAAACPGTAAGATEQAAASLQTALLRQIRQHIDPSLADPELGPDSLAGWFHLSRARLYRMFAPLGGVSSYIGRRRLMRIHQAITDPLRFGETLSNLAEHWGFS